MYQPDDMYDAPAMTEIPMKGNEHNKKMTGWEAQALDNGDMYVEYDLDCAAYGVFGLNSGHCYASFSDEHEAEAWVSK